MKRFARKASVAAIVLALMFAPVIILVAYVMIRILPDGRPELFSANTSPDGARIAENFITSDSDPANPTGLIVIRSSAGKEIGQIALPESDPGLFMRWLDDTHLQIMHRATGSNDHLDVPGEVGGIHVSTGTFPALSADDAHTRLGHTAIYDFSSADVSASFSEGSASRQTRCHLRIGGTRAGTFEAVGIDIDASDKQCVTGANGLPNCGGMFTRYWVKRSSTGSVGPILTSADVSDTHGYGMLPTGDHHAAIRGQFLAESATRVAEVLANGPFSIDYNFEFSDQTVRYRFPLSAIEGPALQFLKCMGASDLKRAG